MSRDDRSESSRSLRRKPAVVTTTDDDWVSFKKTCLDRNVTVRDALGRLARVAVDQPYLIDGGTPRGR